MNVFLLRKIREDDLETRVEWLNDPRINNTMFLTLPITIENTQKWYNNIKNDKSRVDLVLELNSTIISMTGFTNKTPLGYVESYTFVNPNSKSKGYGTISLFMKIVYGFKIFGVKKVISIIKKENTASIKMCKKLGYQENENAIETDNQNSIVLECTPETFNNKLLKVRIKNNEIIYIEK